MYMRNVEGYMAAARKNKVKDPAWAGEACIAIGGGAVGDETNMKYSGIGAFNMTEQQLRDKLAQAYTDDTGTAITPNQKPTIKFTQRFRILITP